LKYEPVSHDREAFLKKAGKSEGIRKAYDDLDEEYRIVREMLSARSQAGLTQEAVAALMGTTKSAASRLESGGTHTPSIAALKKYAKAVGCNLEIRLVRRDRPANRSAGSPKKHVSR
jgi:predicted XRE-type DNA-binding protein